MSEARLVVAGLVFFEIWVPHDKWPPDGQERLVARVPIGVGGAANTASVAHALDLDTCLAYPAGGGLTDAAVRSAVESLGVPAHTWPAGDDPAVSLVCADARDRCFVTRADYDALSRCPTLPACNWVHVPGLREARALQEQLARARGRGATVSVAGSWAREELDRLVTEGERRWDLLLLNEAEACRAAGDVEGALEALTEVASDVVVTLAAEGAVARIGDAHVRVNASEVEAVDPTGAGDGFAAGLISARLDGHDAKQALRRATHVAARVVTQRGGVARHRELFADLGRAGR